MNQHLGGRIKQLRTKRGLTLKELGEAIDFNYSNLSKIERGQRKPTIEILESLSSYFKVHIAYFFGEAKDSTHYPYSVDVEWLKLSEEMKNKNISLDELRELADILDRSRRIKNPS